MLDFNHILNTPGIDVQYFVGNETSNVTGPKSWIKPRGAKMIYMLAVGPGGGGGSGINTGSSSGGGAGGGSGGQSTLFIPAQFVPEELQIVTPAGGLGATTSGAQGNAPATFTSISIEPNNVGVVLSAAASNTTGATQATSTLGGTAGTAASVFSPAQAQFGGRGIYSFIAGQAGSNGGSSTLAGSTLTIPTTGLIVTGGTGGGGTNGTGQTGGPITGAGLGGNFPSIPGSPAASGSTPASNGCGGTKYALMYYGGTGGGGASGTSGGNPGKGADGAPGCGGGGGGGSTTGSGGVLGTGGNGGPGFVFMITFF